MLLTSDGGGPAARIPPGDAGALLHSRRAQGELWHVSVKSELCTTPRLSPSRSPFAGTSRITLLLAVATQVEHARTMIEERFVPLIEKVKARSPLRPC